MSEDEIREMQRIDAETVFLVNTRWHNFLQHNRKELLELALDGFQWREAIEPSPARLKAEAMLKRRFKNHKIKD